MTLDKKRASGVTPGLNKDYAKRTAEEQAAFLLPYLKPGMNIIDVGCGPGSITLGIAKAVAPGLVTGIDHDSVNIEKAEGLAEETGIENAAFKEGDVLPLPFEDKSFDGAFENNVFTHLAGNSVQCAKEVYRTIKTGGFFGARDADADSVVWGNISEPIKKLDSLFKLWHKSRGSDITLGKRLPAVLREAGFINIVTSISGDTKSSPEDVHSHAEITLSLIDGPFGKAVLENEWADEGTLKNIKETIKEWGENPDSFFSNVHVEVIGWKGGN